MKSTMRFITVTPAGRRRYLEVLTEYLLRNRHEIDEHHWWVNTRNPDDLAYLHGLIDEHPDFFKLVAKPIDHTARIGWQIWHYMSDCVEPDTVYLRLDDDICYVADDAIPRMRDHRLENPEPFLVLGSIVNNAICSHAYQRAGVIPRSWGEVHPDCLDPVGWGSGAFAKRLHELFLSDLESGREERWMNQDMSFDGVRRFSVNAICWRGEDMAPVAERGHNQIDEEEWLTQVLPARYGRPSQVCPGALFGHYAFYSQRKRLDLTAPELLDRYRRLAMREAPAGLVDGARIASQRAYGKTVWGVRAGIHAAKHGAKRLLGQDDSSNKAA
ncbi:hypothetical protein MalM25_05470 [Planctomycetes bacterium MalM25]|nr:hypothetical protein MalM25_05470 [Planctomycetes bacterium MalM25]